MRIFLLRAIKVCLILVVLLLLAVAFLHFIIMPTKTYLSDGMNLINIRKDWLYTGAPKNPHLEQYSNDRHQYFVYTNSFNIEGKTYDSLFAMSTTNYGYEGLLIVTKDGNVILIKNDRKPKIVIRTKDKSP